MTMKFIKKQGIPSKTETLDALERNYGISVPKELKDYYLQYGDSEIKWCKFKLNNILYDVAAMIPIEKNNSLSFDNVMKDIKDWIPANLYPFAYNAGGDFYFWNSKNLKVYIIFSDTFELTPDYICDSIGEFFNMMDHSVQ